MDICLLWVLSVVRYRSVQRTDHSSRGVLPTVACRVWSKNLVNEEALAHWGGCCTRKIYILCIYYIYNIYIIYCK